MRGHIVVVGSINMDLVVRAPRHPQPGETILGTSFQTFPGGKGANQAVAAARLGGEVYMVGRVGDDDFGKSMLATLQDASVDTRFVLVSEKSASGVALITVSDAGQNNIVVVPGANALLTQADVQAAESVFQGAAIVVCQLEIPLPAVREAARLAHAYGAAFILNPAPAQLLDPPLLSQVDYLIPNEQELALLTGMDNTSLAINAIRDLGMKHIIVTLGSEGALVMDQGEVYRLDAYPVAVIDTTAAGDAFVGAFAQALAEGKDGLAAAAWGNAAGALTVTRSGAQPSLPNRAALDEFFALHPVQVQR
jgi:ribokinase